MAASNSFLANVPKLKGRENYDEWAFAAENLLILEGMAKCIKHESALSEAAEDAKAKAKLILTIDPSLYVHIKGATTTRSLWLKLKSMFDDSGFSRRISLLRNLISIRLDNCDSMTSYVTQIIETAQKLQGTGFSVNDEWIGCLMLAGLPEKYFPMIMAIEHSGIAITADVVKTKLIDLAGGQSDSAGSAFFSKGQNGRPRQHYSNPKVGSIDSRRKDVASDQHGGGAGGSVSRSNSNVMSNVNKADKSKIICYRCRLNGHFRSECKAKMPNKQESKKTNAFSAVFLSGNFSKSDFYVDSGSTGHVVSDVNMLSNISYSPTVKQICAANKSTMSVLCSGEVDIVTVTPNFKYEVTLKEVLCVPDLRTNLISVSQLIKNGNKVQFEKDCCKIYNKKNSLVAIASLCDGVYKLEVEHQNSCLFTSPVEASSEVWHRRLGHINMSDQNKMKSGAVTGVSYTDKAVISKSTCTVCCEGKQSRLPFGQGTRSSEPLDTVHADVCGPMEVTSVGGARYFLVFVDDFTRMAFVYFLKAKSEVFMYFKEFKSLVENQQNKKIKIFRTDNGLEFCSNEFEDYLKDAGIIHQKTNPYTPEQNGMSERINRTIVERARCLLFDAGLDKKFWAEATNTAVYLRNRSVASGLNDKTPYELWHKRKPDLSHVRIFGSEVMVHIPKEKRLKWDTKSKKHILVGFSENVKGYRVYDPTKRCVNISRDVIIHENLDRNCIMDESVSVSVGDAIQTEQQSSSHIMKEEEIKEESPDLSISDSQYHNADLDTMSTECQKQEEKLTSPEPVVKRTRKQPERYGYTNMCTTSSPGFSGDPITIQEALNSSDRDKWIEAMKDELQAFQENEAWVQVSELPPDKTLVQCKWVYKRKLNSDNSVRYRARLVAKGFTQKLGIDYQETFSPVVRHSTLKLLFALSVQLNFDVTHLDVKTAFLNGYLKEDIYMVQPDINCDPSSKNKIVKLKKAIYGLKQSSRCWYERVEQCLCELGFQKNKIEPCLFSKTGSDNVKIIIALYVDDFFVFSNSKSETENLISVLSSKFKIKNLGQVQHCLGMRVKIDKNCNVITIDQEQYVEELLAKFNMQSCKFASTPMECKLNIEKSDTCNNEIPFQQLIGSLMYLSVLTRPDISFSVSFLSQFNKCYTNVHWNYAKRILRYLNKTKNYCLKYVKGKAELEGFVDSDWGSSCIDRKSYTGFCFLMSGSAISWESRKQRTVALSSMEAEYMSIAEACKEAIYLKSLLSELVGSSSTVLLYNDSQSAQKLVANYVCHRKSKHIDIRYHFIKDAVNDKIIDLKYLPTTDMPADVLTKALNPVKHYSCLEGMGVQEMK